MLSLTECRRLLGPNSPESDERLTEIRDQLHDLARVIVEASNERFDYEAQERAAIHEFEGHADRRTADRMALLDRWRERRG